MDLTFLTRYVFYDNSLLDYSIFILIFLGLLIIFRFFKFVVINRLKNYSKGELDSLAVDIADVFGWNFFALLALFISLRYLTLPEIVTTSIFYVVIVFFAYYGVKAVNKSIIYAGKRISKKKEAEGDSDTAVISLLVRIGKAVVWLIAFLIILSNFGIEITPLIAGLGIGGLAIAIALQGVLSDLFASFTIYFDKPFRAGDFIIIGSDMGIVQDIGIKSTRIKTLHGQELIVSNQELTSTRINNYRKLEKRRVVFHFGVEYSTPVSKVKKIPGMAKKIIDKAKLAEFDRAHFQKFGDFSLDFEVVYFVNVNDFAKYMDTQQEINVKLMEAFEKEKIVFAFPTQTLHIASHKKE